MQPTQNSTTTGNPQNIGNPGVLQQQGNLQPTASLSALSSDSSGIKLDIDAADQSDIAAYVQQQAAPPTQSPIRNGVIIGLAASILLILALLWYIGWRAQKSKTT